MQTIANQNQSNDPPAPALSNRNKTTGSTDAAEKASACKALTKELEDAWGRRNALRNHGQSDYAVSEKMAAQENAQAAQNYRGA